MVKLALIDTLTYRDGLNNMNDCVCIRDSSHQFDPNEINLFNIVDVSGTVSTVKSEMRASLPEMKQVIQNEKDEWVETTPALLDSGNPIKVIWQDGATWKEIQKMPKYMARYSSGSWAENISGKAENHTAITLTVGVANNGTS